MATEQSVSGSEQDTKPAVTLSFLLVTHNSQSVLPGLIASLKHHPPKCAWELVIVDNASHDATVAMLQREFDSATIIPSGANHGFAWGVNRAAADAHGTYYCLVNPDVEWDKGTIDRLLSCCRGNEQIGAVTPELVYPDGRPQLSLRRFPTHRNIWLSRGVPAPRVVRKLCGSTEYTHDYPRTARPVEAAAAACLLIRAEAFRAINGFDDQFFLYVEDTDFCRRLQTAGWAVWCEPNVTVRHQWSEGTRHNRELAAHHRNSIRHYFRKHHADKPIRNMLLFAALTVAGMFDWLYIKPDREGQDV
ncbi:MAG: glycosyltransferase [candidate division Zixibacteria bacterium]|nr:glycosyltransferase [candidate division Zixibacteria bacterium]